MLIRAESGKEKVARFGRWHPWFAWYPVRVHDGRAVAWLEWVERKVEFCEGPIYYFRKDSTDKDPGDEYNKWYFKKYCSAQRFKERYPEESTT